MKSVWKVLVTTAVVLCVASAAAAQGDYFLEYVGSLNTPSGTASDVWGWTAPNGDEYAIMGYTSGLYFAQTYPTLQFITTKPGPTGGGGSIWRDIKSYGNYVYTVSEASGTFSGISVYDMSFLPDSVHYVGSFPTNGSGARTSHNIHIDLETGYAYVEGSFSEQVRILDIATDPENPTFVNSFGTASSQIHDIYSRNDTVFVSEGSTGTWSVWDLGNKLSPTMIARVSVPAAGYVHNAWPSDDRQWLVTTEETDWKTVKIWDISDLSDVSLVSEYLGPNGMAHNAHWMGDFHVNSHYEAGIQLMDVRDPLNPVEWDRVDTYPTDDGNSYNGNWGAFPFTQNGYIYASNVNDGKLWVFNLGNTCATAAVPNLIDPAEATTGLNQPFEFTWEDVNADDYDFQVSEEIGFGTATVDVNTASTSYMVSGLPYLTSCYWRVRSNNECGPSEWSSPQEFTTGCVVAITGDVNVDGAVTSADLIDMVNYVFKSGSAPQPIEEAGDVNCSGAVSSEDIVIMVNYTFKSGPEFCDACSLL